jgi:hypothetical protein
MAVLAHSFRRERGRNATVRMAAGPFHGRFSDCHQEWLRACVILPMMGSISGLICPHQLV